MRIFLAGASGVIGRRLVPLLLQERHQVVGMTRTPQKADHLRELGAEPVVCDVFDADALKEAVAGAAPELVMHQLTDLPDDLKRLAFYIRRNNRIRTEGTRNLIAAAQAAGASRLVAQSIAFKPPGAGRAVEEHERMVLDAGGTVLRYGWFYGPGTHVGDHRRRVPSPRIHVDEAARRTVELLDSQPGVVVVSEALE
jgi:nucleoside-diphosphate-sugar epimerase